MVNFNSPSLLPSGLYDLLPPQAAHERYVSGKLLDVFERFSYQQVSPPLMEFETSLLAGKGASLSSQTFRVMDPYSQEMLGFRPDITMQVARIATSRLGDYPRPLRLCYHGNTLRVRGEASQHARQHRQAGIEIIGDASPEADAEALAVAVEALGELGIKEIVVDLNLSGLVQTVLEEENLSGNAAIQTAIECKDSGALQDIDGLSESTRNLLTQLIKAAGPYEKAMAALEAMKLPDAAKFQVGHVKAVAEQIVTLGVDATLTLDPVENRGFEYHALVSFSIFARGVSGELGRGGRYQIAKEDGSESATGITLYVNTLLEVVKPQSAKETVDVSGDTSLEECRKLQADGKVTRWVKK